MRLVSFNPFRSLGLSDCQYLKPEALFRHRNALAAADWVLFPEYWQVNALVYGMGCRVFPSVSSYHLGHDKIEMTRAFWAVYPEHVPETRILPATDTGVEEALDTFLFPMVVKEPRNAMGNGVFLVETPRALRELAGRLDRLYVQEYLPIERDLRVVVVGREVVAAYWRVGAPGAFHNNVARGGHLDFDAIPPAAVALVERVAAALGVDHAGFDVAVVDGHCYLLEFNVFFGNEGLRSRGTQLAPRILEYLRCQAPSDQGPPGVPPRRQAS